MLFVFFLLWGGGVETSSPKGIPTETKQTHANEYKSNKQRSTTIKNTTTASKPQRKHLKNSTASSLSTFTCIHEHDVRVYLHMVIVFLCVFLREVLKDPAQREYKHMQTSTKRTNNVIQRQGHHNSKQNTT